MQSVFSIGITVLVGMFYCWTSRLNALFFFGRTTDANMRESEEARVITRQYLTGIAVTTIAATAIAAVGGYSGHRIFGPVAVLLELVAVSAIFARANGQVRQLAKGYVSTDAPRESVIRVELLEQPTYWIPGLSAILLPLAICAGTLVLAVWLAAHGAGMSAGWTAFNNSMDGAGDAGLLGLATGLLASSGGILLVFRSSARLRTKMAQYTVRASISLEWVGTTLLVVVLACNHYGVQISRGVGKGVILAAMIFALIAVVWNQSRYKRFVPPPVELGSDDRWRWGLFYVDRADPALFVQSRCGAGYSLNYGRMAAWPISLGLLAYVVVALFFLPYHH